MEFDWSTYRAAKRLDPISHPKPTVDPGYPTKARGRIPAFPTIEEEAAFSDTHDRTEFVGQEMRPVEVTIGGEFADRLTVGLDQADRGDLAMRARTKGIGPSTLARMWLKEPLHQEAEAETRAR